jgi:hypothetical protein
MKRADIQRIIEESKLKDKRPAKSQFRPPPKPRRKTHYHNVAKVSDRWGDLNVRDWNDPKEFRLTPEMAFARKPVW